MNDFLVEKHCPECRCVSEGECIGRQCKCRKCNCYYKGKKDSNKIETIDLSHL